MKQVFCAPMHADHIFHTQLLPKCLKSALRANVGRRYRDTKTVDGLPGKGETRATSSKEDKMTVALFKHNPTFRLRETKAKLTEKGLHVSINIIRRRLAETKVQYRPTRQKPLLSEVHMEKRLVWATENVSSSKLFNIP